MGTRGDAEIGARELIDSTFRAIRDAIFVVALPEREIVLCNEAAAEMFEMPMEELVGSNTSVIHVDQEHWREFHEMTIGPLEEQGHFRGEFEMKRADGTSFPTEHMISFVDRDDDGNPTHSVSVVREITERRRYRKQLEDRALEDGLTGLANRTLFRMRLDHALDRAERSGEFVAAAFVDVARFQVVNKTLGHSAGDELLQRLGQRLQLAVDEAVTVARFGGDKFVALFEHLDTTDEVLSACEEIVEAMTESLEIAGTVVHPELSVGVAGSEPENDDAGDLLRYADVALFAARSREGTAIHRYDPDRDTEAADELHRENALRRAVDRREFTVRYQPVVDLDTGDTVGAEALMRWDHPELGIVSPAEFLDLAEQTGLIVEIGYQILEEAARDAAAWVETDDTQPFRLGVNLSATQYRAADLVDRVREILSETEFPVGQLVIEITENILVTGNGKLSSLRDDGVRLAIDDFGTGFASLQYLRRLDADELKIDRSFLSGLVEGHREQVLVQTMIEVGQKCGLDVVTEGVETERQLAMVTDMGADLAQGYYFAKPMEAEEFSEQFLED